MTAINSNRAIRGPVTAVPVVAGKGVRLVADTENNRWVVEADETVLYSNASGSTTPTLSETPHNFERCRVTYMGGAGIPVEVTFDMVSGQNAYDLVANYFRSDSQNFVQFQCTTMTLSNGGTTATFSNGSRLWLPANSSDTQTIKCTKVVGINRVSGGN